MAKGGRMADDEPMSPDKQFLLDVHQTELVKRIDLEHTHLLDLLRDRGILWFSQHEDIRVLPENKKCEEAIKILQKKTDREFDEFCGALRETGHGHLVHHYLSKAAIHKRISYLQRRLATYYSNTYKDDMFTYHQESYRVPLEGLYQPLQWVEHQRSQKRTTTKPLDSYLDLFKQTGVGRFIVTAEANGGKTTMLRKICHDWADQHLHVDGAAGEEHLSKFIVVVPIILRAVKQGASLVDAIKQQLGLTGKDDLTVKDVKTLIYCLTAKMNENCFIHDGLDEYNVDKSEEVTAVMSGDLYPSSWCIITSRPEGASCVDDWPNVEYREAELKGFSEQSIRKYVDQFFGTSDAALGHRLIRTILPEAPVDTEFWSTYIEDTHVGIKQLASNPGRLALICIIYCEKEVLPSTKEQLTEEFVKFMLRRWEQKSESKLHEQATSLAYLDLHKDVLLIFAELACQTDGGKMKLVFSHKDVKHIDSDMIKVGFLYKSHPVFRLEECEYSFVHKSIQEYLATYYLYHCQLDSTAAVQAVFEELLEVCKYMDDSTCSDRRKYLISVIQVWVLCDYVPLQQLSLLLTEALHQPGQWEAAQWILVLLLRALSHVPLAQMALPEPVTVEHDNKRITFLLPVYAVSQWDEDNQQLAPPAVRILQHHDRSVCELTWPVHLQALWVLDVETGENEELKIDAYIKCNQTAALTYHHQLPLVLTGPSVEHLELRTAGRTNVTSLNKGVKSIEISESQLRGKGAWLAHTLACLDCREISIQTCGLQQQDLQAMNAYLEEHHSSLAAETLYFNKNDLSGAGQDIVKLLQHMSRLSNVDLGDTNLSGGDIQQMNAYLEEHHSSLAAETLYLNKNDLSGAGRDIVKLLQHMLRLSTVHLGKSGLSDDDQRIITTYINGLQKKMEVCMEDTSSSEEESSSDEDSEYETDEQRTEARDNTSGTTENRDQKVLHDCV